MADKALALVANTPLWVKLSPYHVAGINGGQFNRDIGLLLNNAPSLLSINKREIQLFRGFTLINANAVGCPCGRIPVCGFGALCTLFLRFNIFHSSVIQ